MAEEEQRWRQRHAHESNAISYGTIGTASYHESAQKWAFLRYDPVERDVDDRNDEPMRDTPPLLRILSDPMTVAEPTYEANGCRRNATNDTLHSRYSGLAAASSTIRGILPSETDISSVRTAGNTVSFGHAVWLGADGKDSGNLTVPISAHATGPGRDSIHIACVGRRSFDLSSKDGVSSSIKIPSLSGDPQTSWVGSMPIQQVLFAQRDPEGRGGTFLAVRQVSQTSIFEPLLHRGDYASSLFAERSSLGSNLLLALPSSRTGGQDHADVCFHPYDQRKLAIVDIEGNWSIWHIQGRRTHTARVLYKIVLQASSKIFSWEHKSRPKGAELYFDGWHKVLWILINGNDVGRMLVCNRQDAKLFDTKGTNMSEVCSVDIRLDTRKQDALILDVKPGPMPNFCFILTTSRLLLFDFAQTEWKDTGSVKGPSLLCAWEHFQHAPDLSLRISTLELGETMLLALYSSNSTIVQLYSMLFTSIDDKLCLASDNASIFYLPEGLPDSPITSLSLAALETSGNERFPGRQGLQLVQLIVQHKNLAVATITVEVSESVRPQSGKQQPMLRLPRNRSMQRKSRRLVDELEDEDDLVGVIVYDEETEDSNFAEDVSDGEKDGISDTADLKAPPNEASKVLHLLTAGNSPESVMAKVLNEVTSGHSTPRCDMPKALERLGQRLQDPSTLQDISQAMLLSNLFDEGTSIEDIETDSATLERALHIIGSAAQDKLQISTPKNEHSRPLLQTYEDLFAQYLNSFNPAVPDRFRVQRERQTRNVALELYLSSRTIRRLRLPNHVPMEYGETMPDSDPIILSDPIIQQDEAPRSTPAQLSASQPAPRPSSSHASTPAITSSPLEDAIARLSSYTTISRPPTQDSQDNASTHISSILYHLPGSADANPNDYDWQATELNLAAGDDASKGKTSSKADRKVERLARARKGAHENLQRQLLARDAEVALPAMTPGDALAMRPLRSDMQPQYMMSEGNEPLQSSSQGAGVGMTSTQPVSGTHANRAAVKKKKKRVAGF